MVSSFGLGCSFCIKTSMVLSPNLFSSFPTQKRQKRDFAKNSVSSDIFYPSIGSIPDKTSSTVNR
jgi:hypothetical protein